MHVYLLYTMTAESAGVGPVAFAAAAQRPAGAGVLGAPAAAGSGHGRLPTLAFVAVAARTPACVRGRQHGQLGGWQRKFIRLGTRAA